MGNSLRVKGTAFVARRREIARRFGEERWEAFVRDLARRDSFFEDAVFVTSRVPLERFIEFHEALIDAFFDGREDGYRELGTVAAEWALTEGPYAVVLRQTEGALDFLEQAPSRLWETYYDFGEMSVDVSENRIEVTVEEMPISHPYFRLAPEGYMLEALRQLGARDPVAAESSDDGRGNLRWVFLHGGFSD